jgi:tellurite methyltransferase
MQQMSDADRARWDAKYAEKSLSASLHPDDWLVAQIVRLPPGRALEPACGLGHNSVWLARHGWSVDAVDISQAGLKLAAELAARENVVVHWIAADLDAWAPPEGAYDLVVVLRYLERARLPRLIMQVLRPGGVLLYETFTAAHLARPDSRMKNPAFALAPGELPRLFPELQVVEYSEIDLPDRSVARLVAKKRRDTNHNV